MAGHSASGDGVVATSGSGCGVYSLGNLHVQGTLCKTGGTFRITDGEGRAVVELPAYFEALNQDFRYQLTVLGRFAQAIVEEEISGNRFVIRTNLAHVKVSWQVTAASTRSPPSGTLHQGIWP